MVPEQWCMTEGLSTWVSDTTTCRLWFAFLESEWYLCTPSGLPLSKWSMGSLQIISATMHNSCYSILFLVMHIYICSYMYIHVYPILRPTSHIRAWTGVQLSLWRSPVWPGFYLTVLFARRDGQRYHTDVACQNSGCGGNPNVHHM